MIVAQRFAHRLPILLFEYFFMTIEFQVEAMRQVFKQAVMDGDIVSFEVDRQFILLLIGCCVVLWRSVVLCGIALNVVWTFSLTCFVVFPVLWFEWQWLQPKSWYFLQQMISFSFVFLTPEMLDFVLTFLKITFLIQITDCICFNLWTSIFGLFFHFQQFSCFLEHLTILPSPKKWISPLLWNPILVEDPFCTPGVAQTNIAYFVCCWEFCLRDFCHPSSFHRVSFQILLNNKKWFVSWVMDQTFTRDLMAFVHLCGWLGIGC